MITEHQEVARYRVAEQLQAAEARALRRGDKPRRAGRHGLATALRHLADRLEPARLADRLEPARRPEPQPRHRGTGLSIVR
jgi:predicted component of type VI protein secretion system